jgi:hypothetical protein
MVSMRLLVITFLLLTTFLSAQSNPGELTPEELTDFNPSQEPLPQESVEQPVSAQEEGSNLGTGREFLIEKLDFGKPVYPQDWYSGPVYRSEENPGTKAQIITLLDLLLGDLSRKVLPENALHGDFRAVLIPSLTLFTDNLVELNGYRFSDFTPDEGTAMVPVTLFGERAVTRGVIYVKVDGDRGWRVEDIQVDWSELELFDQEKEPFRPGSFPRVFGPGIY